MQGMLLRDLLSRAVKQRGFFDSVEIDELVAISDSGTIQWPASGALMEVCKADQVPERIRHKLGTRQASGAAPSLLPSNRQTIAAFLQQLHQPLARTRTAVKTLEQPEAVIAVNPAPPAEPYVGGSLPGPACKHCGSGEVAVEYGKFGYYFHCDACEKNTAIRFTCPACGGEGKIRKLGREFFAECRACDASAPFHVNK